MGLGIKESAVISEIGESAKMLLKSAYFLFLIPNF